LDLGAVVRSLLDPGVVFSPSDIFALSGLFVVLIAETGRIPVDNPATHLELTMIHEAMVLEYAGPDLALVEWASAIKELVYITLLIDLFMPLGMATTIAAVPMLIALAVWACKVLLFAVVITLVESTNAKLRLFRVPELVAVALGLGFLALAIRFL
jgi:formate hydrogenlyase subunit 4